MAIYVNGKKIKSIYVGGESIGVGYSNGRIVFSKKQGWQLGPDTTINVTSANNNSISGTITLNRYDYYEGGAITDRYYQVAAKSLSRTTDGVVELNLGANTAVVFGNAASYADYPVNTTGTIRLSAAELNNMYRLRKLSGVLELGTTVNVTSKYLEPVQDMVISQLSTDLYMTAGWAIASNRVSRLKTNSAMTVTLSSLNVPKEGTWPVYAVASSGTEVTTESLTCSTSAHYTYDSANIRHVGWVTVASGAITNVISLATATGAAWSKSISGSTLTVSAGYATDTDGCKVYVPRFTYSFSDMITAAADKEVDEVLGNNVEIVDDRTTNVKPVNGNYAFWASGSPHYNEVATSNKRFKVVARKSNTQSYVDTYTVYYSRYQGTNYPDINNLKQVPYDMDHANGGTTNSILTFYMPTQSTIYNITVDWSGAKSNNGTHIVELSYRPVNTEASTTPGTTQTRTVYVKVTRNQNNSNKTTSTQTSTGNSSPYVSYIRVGTITVTRNSNTGTIS